MAGVVCSPHDPVPRLEHDLVPPNLGLEHLGDPYVAQRLIEAGPGRSQTVHVLLESVARGLLRHGGDWAVHEVGQAGVPPEHHLEGAPALITDLAVLDHDCPCQQSVS